MYSSLNNLRKLSLGFFPTPIAKLSRLSQELGGPSVLIKRDDNTGLGLGGNKTRKLEYILGDALDKGAGTIITAGAAQSNHCRQTAAAAAHLGLECHLLLGGDRPEIANGNLLLDQLFDCQIHWAGDNRKGEDMSDIVAQLSSLGKKVYVVPYGGSNVLGTLAFVDAFKELQRQIQRFDKPLTHIVFASSSGGTHSGLVLGKLVYQSDIDVVGINIDKEGVDGRRLDDVVFSLANEAAELINFSSDLDRRDVILNSDYVGGGYGVIGDLEKEAMLLTARLEGILLDPIYTARAMGGLIDMIRFGKFDKDDQVLFWHTGGAPALFAHAAELSQVIA